MRLDEKIASFSAGLGESLLGLWAIPYSWITGGSPYDHLRQWLGINDLVRKDSSAYAAGIDIGTAVAMAQLLVSLWKLASANRILKTKTKQVDVAASRGSFSFKIFKKVDPVRSPMSVDEMVEKFLDPRISTAQSKTVAELIKQKKVKVVILSDKNVSGVEGKLFTKAYIAANKDAGEVVTHAKRVNGFYYKGNIVLKNQYHTLMMSTLVHEGTHALDVARKGSSWFYHRKGVNHFEREFRAFWHQREYDIAAFGESDFAGVNAIIKHIDKLYGFLPSRPVKDMISDLINGR